MKTNQERHAAAAFTLIELLIVVAIIAILAAIAIPNLLEAQVRAKVSRAKNDLRTLATGIEAYSADYQAPPFDGEPGFAHYGWVNAYSQLTTPVAYLSSIPADPFSDGTVPDSNRPGHTHYLSPSITSYDYSTARWEELDLPANTGKKSAWQRNMGNSTYKTGSAGPDTEWVNPGSFYGLLDLYDPTNGTRSLGDVVRSQGGQRN
jgi:prepilin-type N-terminal cleavage/methylation domain-containing protein